MVVQRGCLAFLICLTVSVSAYSQSNCIPQENTELDNLTGVVSRTDQILRTEQGASWCSPLAVGRMRAVDLTSNQSPTGVQMRYNLERTNADTYTASVALNYIPDTTPGQTPSIGPNEMLEETRRCLESVSSQFETPSGKKLRINILSPSQAQSNRFNDSNRPPVVDINLGRTGGTSASHGQDMECATRAHEILHLMGLVDEYDHITGNSGGNTANLTCKPVARSSNIMTNNTSSALNSFGHSNRNRERLCRCKAEAESCKLAAKRKNENLFYYMYARFSSGQATRLGYSCQRSEVSAASSVAVTASSSIPAPNLTANQNGFVVRTYEFQENDRSLKQVQMTCQCLDPARCNVSSSNFLDALYRVDTNSCPVDMDNNGDSVLSVYNTSEEFGASRIRANPYEENAITFAVNKPFDGLKEYQFNRILAGGCQTVNDSYTRCSSYASRVWAGTSGDPTCSQRPVNCYEEE